MGLKSISAALKPWHSAFQKGMSAPTVIKTGQGDLMCVAIVFI